MSDTVLDASAILAVIREERGGDLVADVIDGGAVVSAVNLSEVVAKLLDFGSTEEEARAKIESLRLEVISPFNEDDAWSAGLLRSVTRSAGLSLGDRACLALALSLELPVLTADRNWAGVDVGVQVQLCR